MYAICSQATWLVMVSRVMTRNYMGAWRTWRRPPTSSLLVDWSCRRTRRRRRRLVMVDSTHIGGNCTDCVGLILQQMCMKEYGPVRSWSIWMCLTMYWQCYL